MKEEKKQLEDCCQVCEAHANNPSRCTDKADGVLFYVGRKNKPCKDYRRKKGC